MDMNNTQTGQPTPIKTHARTTQCDQIIASMRAVITKANAKCAEQKRINKPLLTASIADKFVKSFGAGEPAAISAAIARAADARHRDTTYHALAHSMPMHSQLQAGA